MVLLFSVSLSYLIGSIPTGFLFAKFIKKVDIRKHGSGNVGATNVLRTVGKVPAVLTLAIDISKGYFVVAFLARTVYTRDMGLTYPQYVMVMGLAVVIGHIWNVFLRFKGGKGIATSGGVLLGACPKLLLAGVCAWLLIFILTRIVSIASIIASASIPAASYFISCDNSIRLLAILLAAMTIAKHQDNIKRILKGEEKKISFGKK